MTGLVIALPSEARPFIDALNLKKEDVTHRFETFRSTDVALVVSGVGRLKAAIATTLLIHRYQPTNLLNIGIAGSRKLHRAVGACFLINKIMDVTQGREFYPDLVVDFDLPEASVTTFDHAVKEDHDLPEWVDLVDMECSGYFEAASMFTEIHRIQAMKIVSDHLDVAHVNARFVSELVAAVVPDVINVLKALPAPEEPFFEQAELDLMAAIGTSLKLTVTQRHQLTRWARAAKINGQSLKDVFQTFKIQDPESRSGSKQQLEQLRRILN